MFEGCTVALVTPFKNDAVDYEALDALVDFHLERGTNAISPCGTTGESPTLDFDEHEAVIRRVVKRANGRLPILAGTGANSTAEALRLTRFAATVGADGALLVSPYYNKPEPEGMYRHFKRVADEVDIPMVLYNVPSRTGRAITPETVARLAEHRNVVAIKQAYGDMDQVSEIRRLCDITILSGDDSLTLPMMALGGRGVVSVVANIVPEDVVAMVRAFEQGDAAGARALHHRLYPLCRAMFVETNPIPVKAAMHMLGRLSNELRLPLSPLSPEKAPAVRKALEAYGLLS